MQAWPYYAHYPCACTPVCLCFFPYSKRSDNSLLRMWGHFGISKCQHSWWWREKWKEVGGRLVGIMMKNKANARVAATGHRGISLILLQDLVDGGKDKGWAKKMLCFSLHGLLIYLCPILGNPCSRHLEAKASKQPVCPKRIHYLR